MTPEWITDFVFISFFVYALTSILVLMFYIILRWRETRLTLEYAAYFTGSLLSVAGGSMVIILTPEESNLIFPSIFFFTQGVALICLMCWKERRDKRKQQKPE
jgi:hypothetical protein